MDEIDRRIMEDLKSEVVLRKRERQHLSEKLDCLILLIRRAWQGENDAIDEISEIVGIPPPNIIPTTKDMDKNGEIGHEYLHLTSALLDEQLEEDENMRKATKVLRPSSGKRPTRLRKIKNTTPITATNKGPISAPQTSPQQMVRDQNGKESNPVYVNGNHTPDVGVKLASDNFPMGNLNDIVPLFSQTNQTRGLVAAGRRVGTDKEQDFILTNNYEENLKNQTIFNPRGIVGEKKPRPVSAALQRRQDYMRAQGTKKKKPRPHTAVPGNKPAFRHATDSEYDLLVRTNNGQGSPECTSPSYRPDNSPLASPVRLSSDGSPLSISVNISQKGQRRLANHGMAFPCSREDQAFGDVSDALHRVQEMEKLFRLNTKRLQKKIGIPAAGCI